jgi:hypothetical protein
MYGRDQQTPPKTVITVQENKCTNKTKNNPKGKEGNHDGCM